MNLLVCFVGESLALFFVAFFSENIFEIPKIPIIFLFNQAKMLELSANFLDLIHSLGVTLGRLHCIYSMSVLQFPYIPSLLYLWLRYKSVGNFNDQISNLI